MTKRRRVRGRDASALNKGEPCSLTSPGTHWALPSQRAVPCSGKEPPHGYRFRLRPRGGLAPAPACPGLPTSSAQHRGSSAG